MHVEIGEIDTYEPFAWLSGYNVIKMPDTEDSLSSKNILEGFNIFLRIFPTSLECVMKESIFTKDT